VTAERWTLDVDGTCKHCGYLAEDHDKVTGECPEVIDLDGDIESADWIKTVERKCPHCGKRETEVVGPSHRRCNACGRDFTT